jgi:hypothetical protein
MARKSKFERVLEERCATAVECMHGGFQRVEINCDLSEEIGER